MELMACLWLGWLGDGLVEMMMISLFLLMFPRVFEERRQEMMLMILLF